MDYIELAKAFQGGSFSGTKRRTATVTKASSDGRATVDVGGVEIDVPCVGAVNVGEEVSYNVQNGIPVITGTAGWGDAVESEIAKASAKSGETYATSATAASKAAKEAISETAYALVVDSVVAVTFANSNTASSPTLNVNSTGAIAIRTNGVAACYWEAGATVRFVYDGTYWQCCSSPVYGTTATIGNPSSKNVYIDDSGITIRNKTTSLASFKPARLTLGTQGEGSIDFCGTLGLSVSSDDREAVLACANGYDLWLVSGNDGVKDHDVIIGENPQLMSGAGYIRINGGTVTIEGLQLDISTSLVKVSSGAYFNHEAMPPAIAGTDRYSCHGAVYTTSTVTDATGYIPTPIIDGVPYYMPESNPARSACTWLFAPDAIGSKATSSIATGWQALAIFATQIEGGNHTTYFSVDDDGDEITINKPGYYRIRAQATGNPSSRLGVSIFSDTNDELSTSWIYAGGDTISGQVEAVRYLGTADGLVVKASDGGSGSTWTLRNGGHLSNCLIEYLGV